MGIPAGSRHRHAASWSKSAWVGVVLGASALAPLAAQPVPLGPAFQVNTHTLKSQEYPDVARAADGSFVVVWMSEAAEVWEYDIHGRRYASDGTPLAPAFPVHGAPTGDQRFPAVALLADGGFVVAWEAAATNVADNDIMARRFDAGGVPQGPQFRVNTYVTGDQLDADVVADGGGGFVVTWSGPDANEPSAVFARAYEPSGEPRTAPFRVSRVESYVGDASVARIRDGELVAAYRGFSDLHPGSESLIFGRRFTTDGDHLGAEFLVSPSTAPYTYGELAPEISTAPGGDFVVAWTHTEFHHSEPWARRFAADGAPHALEFEVASSGSSVTVSHDAQGAFFLTWDSSTDAVPTRAFAANGSPLGEPFEAAEPDSNGRNARIAFDAESNPVFVWMRFVDGDANDEIDARLFRGTSLLVDGFETGGTERWSVAIP